MSEYTVAKGSKLKLKGEKLVKKKKKRLHAESGLAKEEIELKKQTEADTNNHGGWWKVDIFEEILGSIAIEFGDTKSYMKALDDGRFTVGAPHKDKEPPSPEEIFSAIKINDNKIALKSGYGKYLKVDKNGEVIGRSDAVGPAEQWEPIFQDGKVAVMSPDGCFMSADPEDDGIIANIKKAGPNEMVTLRCQAEKVDPKESDRPDEEKGNLKQVELNYVKKFQKFQDKRMRISTQDTHQLSKAVEEGSLHETLLDRRAKMKADRYCK